MHVVCHVSRAKSTCWLCAWQQIALRKGWESGGASVVQVPNALWGRHGDLMWLNILAVEPRCFEGLQRLLLAVVQCVPSSGPQRGR